MREVLFVTWIEHRRTRQICSRLGLPLVEIVTAARGLKRYVLLTLRTIGTLRRIHPRVLIVQSPSIVLSLLALTLRPFLGFRLVVDAHNEAVEPFLHRSPFMLLLTRHLIRRADLTIVSNRYLAATVSSHAGKPFILPDGIPVPPPFQQQTLPGPFRITLISTFSDDEPFDAVIGAARTLGPAIHIYVTGNPRRLPANVQNSLPENVTLTGFLAEEHYWSLLGSGDAVMDLTTMPNCLVCGAYEALAVGQPMLLSDNGASVELFEGCAIFSRNDPESLVTGLKRLIEARASIAIHLPTVRSRLETRWTADANRLLLLLRSWL